MEACIAESRFFACGEGITLELVVVKGKRPPDFCDWCYQWVWLRPFTLVAELPKASEVFTN